MVKSMTAFANALADSEFFEISWEIKSLNHRYLEVHMRLPEELRSLEVKCRGVIQQHIGRGKLEVVASLKNKQAGSTGIKINSEKVSEIINACNEIEGMMGVGQAISAFDVMAYPGVVEDSQPVIDINEELIFDSLEMALKTLNQHKQQEGSRLETMVLDRAKQLRNIVQTVRKRQPEVKQAIRQKLENKLKDLCDNADSDRLEQELVYLAQKMDVDEELDRLVSHLVSLQTTFTTDGVIGRKLDFIMQEFNREANTLASKSADTETTKAAVDLKVLIEQMREQIQNIE